MIRRRISRGMCVSRMLNVGSRMIRSYVSMYITCRVMLNSVVSIGHEPRVLLQGVVAEALGQNRSCHHHRMGFGLGVALVCVAIDGPHVYERRRRRLLHACLMLHR